MSETKYWHNLSMYMSQRHDIHIHAVWLPLLGYDVRQRLFQYHTMETDWGVEVKLHAFLTFVVDEGELHTSAV
jgi:hypothetical protein